MTESNFSKQVEYWANRDLEPGEDPSTVLNGLVLDELAAALNHHFNRLGVSVDQDPINGLQVELVDDGTTVTVFNTFNRQTYDTTAVLVGLQRLDRASTDTIWGTMASFPVLQTTDDSDA
jgi:hypothetical protein